MINRHFTAYDGNGNVMGLADSTTGKWSARYEYGPFGEPIRVNGDLAHSNGIRWSTKQTDDESGLVYYGFRFYNPITGRWLNRDPLNEAGGNNLYSFLDNGAADIDYLGLCARQCSTFRLEFDLTKFFKWTEGNEKPEQVGKAFARFEGSRCVKCCAKGSPYGGQIKEVWRFAGSAGAEIGTGKKPCPFLGLAAFYPVISCEAKGQVIGKVQVIGTVQAQKYGCLGDRWSGGGCIAINVELAMTFGVSKTIEASGEVGGGCRLCLIANQIDPALKLNLRCQGYGRVQVKVKPFYSIMHEWQWTSDDDTIYTF